MIIRKYKIKKQKLRACLESVFENYSRKWFWRKKNVRIVFDIFRNKITFRNWILKNNFGSKKRFLIELIKRVFLEQIKQKTCLEVVVVVVFFFF